MQENTHKIFVPPEISFKPAFIPRTKRSDDNNSGKLQNNQKEKQDENGKRDRNRSSHKRHREHNHDNSHSSSPEKDGEKNNRREKRSYSRSRSRSRDREKEKEREKERERYITSNTRATIPIKLKGEDKELQSIKIQYLGLFKEKKKVLKPSEKFKNIFNFEWDSTEDTSYDANPLYSHRHEENLLFGRGLKAGVDIREQKRNSCNYESIIKKFEKTENVQKPDDAKDDEKEGNDEKVSNKEKIENRGKSEHREKKYKDKEREKERERKEREKEKNKEKKKNKERERTRDKVREKERDKEKDKDKENGDIDKIKGKEKTAKEEAMELEEEKEFMDRNAHYKFRDLGHSKHWSNKNPNDMTERDWRIFREDNDIIIKGGRVPKPMRNWDENIIPPKIFESIKRIGYSTPTPIQMQAIPIGMECKDLIGIAPTGSGKSAAFLIPLIAYLQKLKPLDDESCKDGPYSLILTPTRELALQIDNEFQKFAIGTKLRSAIVVGGRKTEEQAFYLRKGCEVLIGTPGRIKDALQSKYTVLNQCNWVILDEADKMIDLGFEEDVNFILDTIPQHNMKSEDETTAEFQARIASSGEKIFRVTHLFSATMPSAVERMAKKYLRSFCYISIGEPGGGKKEIEQKVEMITESQKKHRLQMLLETSEPPIIIFVNQKKGVEVISNIVEKWGWKCVMYHGGKTQEQREAAVDGFKNRKYDILIATDLASRGLDVEGVKMVVNFDAPKNIQDFIHRTGRTGRAGKKGLAVTFLTSNNEDLFYDLKEFLIKNNQEVSQELAMHPASKIKPGSIPDNVPRRKQILYIQ